MYEKSLDVGGLISSSFVAISIQALSVHLRSFENKTLENITLNCVQHEKKFSTHHPTHCSICLLTMKPL